MKDFWKYYVCNPQMWLVLAKIICIFCAVCITVGGLIIAIFSAIITMQEISLVNENIACGIALILFGYAVFYIGKHLLEDMIHKNNYEK